MNQDEIITTLNDLIETCRNGEESYKKCSMDASERHSNLQTMFADLQHGCAMAESDLQVLLKAEGGHIRTVSKVSDTVHRGWMHLRTALTGKDDEAVLNDCERGEDAAVQSYKAALKRDLPSSIRTVIERQYQGVLINHNQIKTVRDQVKARA